MKNIVLLKFLLLFLIFIPKTNYAQTPPVITAVGDQTYCPGTFLKIVETLSITHDLSEPSITSVSVQISSGYQSGSDLLSLSNQSSLHSNIATSWKQSEGKLTLSSTTSGGLVLYTDFESALKDVVFSSSSTSPSGIRNFSINLGAGVLSYLPRNQHYYEYVSSLGITWTAAKAAAETKNYYGLTGYLATLTAADEAKLAGEQAPGAGWIGGSDAETEGVWKWVTGPEAGTIFWNGLVNGSTPNFANWNSGEPNQYNGAQEDYAHVTAPGVGITGSWNDLTNTGDPSGNYQPKGYIVEYGGMPLDPILKISASTIITIPKIETTIPASNCGFGIVELGATATNGTVNWYTSSTGGTLIGTGNSYSTPTIYTTTSYYVDATNGNCPSIPRTEVIATIKTIPTITATTPTFRCDAGTVTLAAIASAGTINWYDVATGGTSLGTGTVFTTPNISTTKTYYVDATTNGCTSTTRTAIIATVFNSPTITSTSAAAICNSGTVTLGATTSAGTINWYSTATGGTLLGNGTTFTTPAINTTTTYYVDAVANGCISTTRTAIIATVNNSPTITSTSPSSVCDSGTVTLSAVPSAGTIRWYDAAGNVLNTGNSYTTPIITSTTTYYAEAFTTTCISLTRTAVIATVTNTPTISTTTPNSRCDSGTLTLGATASAGTINWYIAPTGGNSLGTGTTFTTPTISTTTTYYVEAVSNGCISAARTAVVATVYNSPTITSTAAAAVCNSGTVTLGATTSAGTINWYNSATGGTLLDTGTTFTTPTINTTTTYYVDTVANGCISTTRTAIIATVNNSPTITSTSPSSVCDSGTVTLSAVPSAGTIRWYDATGNALVTGNSFTTPIISSTTTYYAEAFTATCISLTRTAVIATVINTPTITSTTPNSRCDSGTVTLEATTSAGQINWYDESGNHVATGNSFTTPILTTTTNYYVDAELSGCKSPKTLITATVYPVDTKTEEVILCQGETTTLDAGVPGMNYLWSPGGEITQSISVSTIGNYNVTISSPTVVSCDSYNNFSVIEHPAPIINSISVNENSITIELANPENYFEYSINGLDFQLSNQFSYIPSGKHTAYVRDKNGCNLIQQDFTIFTIAKYFTPNNDGQNDVWKITEMSEYPNSSAQIFDRYGKLLINLTAFKNYWDGEYNNQILPSDDYWYRLQLNDTTPVLTGHFTLKR